jgi:hypothetical protein
VQLAYEYGYGFDGGRRWRKDYLNGVWTRYPCGVACGAGELVEQQKPLEGGSWTVSALSLQGISLARRNNEWHHFDPLGTAQVITNGSAQVVSNNVYDVFGVLRYEQGSAQTPWRWRDKKEWDECLLAGGTTVYFARTAVTTNNVRDILLRLACEHACRNVKPDYLRRACVEACIAVGKGLVKPAPKPVPKPEPEPSGKEAECAKGKCRTNVPGDIAACCPDGRPFCGPSKDYVPICGIHVKPPVPEPPKPDEE